MTAAVEFKPIEIKGFYPGQWAMYEKPKGVHCIVVQFDGPDNPSITELIYKAAESLWDKVDAGYTEETGAHDVVFTDINVGSEVMLVNLFKKSVSESLGKDNNNC